MSQSSNFLMTRRAALAGMSTLAAQAILMPSGALASQGPGGPILVEDEIISAGHFGIFKGKVEGGRFIRAIPYEGDVHPSPMVDAMPDAVYSTARIRYPMVRKGFLENGYMSDRTERGKGEFVRVTWEQALDLVAAELKRVKETYGNASIYGGSYGWRSSGSFHSAQAPLARMLNLHGGFVDDADNYSWGAQMVIYPYITGGTFTKPTAWPVILENTELMVFWASDPLVTGKIDFAPPDHRGLGYMQQLKASGKRTIVIDPVHNRTAEYLGSEWIAPRPGTDVAMMLGIAHTLYAENLHDEAFLADYTTGFEKFAEYLTGANDGTPKTAEWAANICAVDAETIKDLARTFAANRTTLNFGFSIQRQDHGEQATWMGVTLGCMLGQYGLPGGGAFSYYHYTSGGAPFGSAPAFPGMSAGESREGIPAAIPCARVHWVMDNPGAQYDYKGQSFTAPDLRLVYWAGGNPFHHHQNVNQLIKTWQKPETIIVNEIYWTQTARFADIVLPVTTTFERNDLSPFGNNTGVVAMKKIIEPLYESKTDYDIFTEISQRLGFEDDYTEGRSEMDWVKFIYEAGKASAEKKSIAMPDFDTFWNGEGVVKFEISEEENNYVFLEKFREDPLLNPLPTPSGMIEIYSKKIEGYGYDDCPPHATWLEPVERLGGAMSDKYPLHVVSSHPDDRLHSQLDHTWLRNRYEVQGREPVWINTQDAEARGIKDGEVVRVFNDRGQVLAGAVVTDKVMPGALRLNQGAWYDPDEPGVSGALCKHGHVNVLTIDKGTSKLAQATIAHTALAEVEPWVGALPPVTTFTPVT